MHIITASTLKDKSLTDVMKIEKYMYEAWYSTCCSKSTSTTGMPFLRRRILP
jgi:hypothetical protein